jgi:Dyp-type peroxidase family
MFPDFKYFKKIKQAERQPNPKGPGATPEINFDTPPDPFFKRILTQIVLSFFRDLLWFLQATIWSNPRLGSLVIVTRADDACAVLNNSAFRVPFKPEMKDLGGAESILGLEGGPHAKVRSVIAAAFRTDTRANRKAEMNRIADDARPMARALIENSQGRLDVIGDLITRCAAETCARYYGLPVEDPAAFADWTMAVSQLLFADPFGTPEVRRRALYASMRLQQLVDRGIAEARERRRNGSPDDTIIARLLDQIAAQPKRGRITDAELRANLVGLVTAYVPTSPLAGGKMLQYLLDRPDLMQAAHLAARAGQRDKLEKMLWEAGRLNPALDPGQWRYVARDAVIAKGTWRRRRVKKGDVVLVATATALRDPLAFPDPLGFDPDRNQQPELMFGDGPHWCLGKFVAMGLLTEVFMQLFAQFDLKPVHGSKGRMRWGGPYPRQLDMEFTPPPGGVRPGQSMIAVCAPLSHYAPIDALRLQVEKLGNPVSKELQAALDTTGRVHFLSLNVVDLGEEGEPAWNLLLEVNADGPVDEALSRVASAAGPWLQPIFRHVLEGGGTLFDTLMRNNLRDHAKGWNATHLNFSGVAEFSVHDIDRQQQLADFTRRAVDWYLRDNAASGLPPTLVLRFVRKLIQGQVKALPKLPRTSSETANEAGRTAELKLLLKESRQLRDFVFWPSRRRLKLADWTDLTIWQMTGRVLLSRELRPIWISIALIVLAFALLFFLISPLGGAIPTARYVDLGLWMVRLPKWLVGAFAVFVTFVHCAVVGFLAMLVLIGSGAGIFVWRLRAQEASDPPDTRFPTLQQMKARRANEDRHGYASNHFIATPTLKPGLLRRITLWAAFYGIFVYIKYGFRPGFVLNMGTIHYAKWFRPPGSRRLVFLADYDGSWESYLEDFITKAHIGQTAGWSNCEGFPPTRFLMFDGAQDGDRFKRWVRLQQVPSTCWYSRFPALSLERIRVNALIHHGIVSAHTDDAARAWLACFGSQQRPESTLEADEIQSLVFSPFKELKYGLCAVFRLPEAGPEQWSEWLGRYLVGELDPASMRWTGPEPDSAVTFGDVLKTPLPRATQVAFSASGLARLGVPPGDDGDGLATFPSAFVSGMSRRPEILGDAGDDDPAKWRWQDAPVEGGAPSDGVLMIYANSRQECEDLLKPHEAALGKGAFFQKVYTEPKDGDLRFEHFGFRDGVSQPLIRGAQRFLLTDSPADVVEPGEFILGYKSNAGYFPPTPLVNGGTDALGLLPAADAEEPSPYPGFEEDREGLMYHDFGRNGSFLAVRLLEQDVKKFNTFTERTAVELGATYPELSGVIGAPVSAEWVAAKLVGRWKNGAPLVDWPTRQPESHEIDSLNDFTFGAQDPQGVRCPLGAHIRRANPRDSLQPSDPDARQLTNRHRIIRRGRSYTLRDGRGIKEKGLLFVGVCADLERQFEFIQQTWINAPSFQDLQAEVDPLVGAGGEGGYTIPTAAGPVRLGGLKRFVTTHAGGYYFLPSRSALAYLASRTRGFVTRMEDAAPPNRRRRQPATPVKTPIPAGPDVT